MKLFFYGADKEVTGSCHCLFAGEKRILFDCGMQQGGDQKEDNRFPFAAREIDCVVVTHAHIDHTGRLPLLFKEGYTGPVYATGATCRLMEIMLADSAHIQESDAAWKRKKEKRAGKTPEEPLYTAEDAQAAIAHFVPCAYGDPVQLTDEVSVTFTDAGHLLGSASVTAHVSEAGVSKTIVFSGDIGNKNQPIIRDPQYLSRADYVVMESTYGDRLHEKPKYTLGDLARVIGQTLARGGNVVIPAFSVGRTQELLYHIREIKEQNLVPAPPDFPVYVDSPLALEATHIYDGDLHGYADEQTLALLRGGFAPLSFPGLKLCRTTQESMALNEDKSPKVIISASGMCDAGRIRHHLKHNLWRQECTVVFAGYQAVGTLGRMLLDGIPKVKLFGEEIAVNCQIYNFRGLSAHADQAGLLEWIGAFSAPPQKVFVVHGEEQTAGIFAGLLEQRGFSAYVPNYTACYDLAADAVLEAGIGPDALREREKQARKYSPVYGRLLAAGEKLMEVIRRNQHGANKDLAKFADQLSALSEKWDR